MLRIKKSISITMRGIVARYDAAKAITEAIDQRSAKNERLAGFIKMLGPQKEPMAAFDEWLWRCIVDYVTVGVDGGMTVVFRDGTEI